ncbi:hypothetical protein TCAP_01349 [Tolypocladium capitatum]|uniref:Uncharacterized protein n=1 Tax=Tolypocladium capitatum TaxID=45235 RepID=A0A2K3QMH4_9HYPO|nr:hypothetical protein TCAP_01349 [Tolypocladium capitatum]
MMRGDAQVDGRPDIETGGRYARWMMDLSGKTRRLPSYEALVTLETGYALLPSTASKGRQSADTARPRAAGQCSSRRCTITDEGQPETRNTTCYQHVVVLDGHICSIDLSALCCQRCMRRTAMVTDTPIQATSGPILTSQPPASPSA